MLGGSGGILQSPGASAVWWPRGFLLPGSPLLTSQDSCSPLGQVLVVCSWGWHWRQPEAEPRPGPPSQRTAVSELSLVPVSCFLGQVGGRLGCWGRLQVVTAGPLPSL